MPRRYTTQSPLIVVPLQSAIALREKQIAVATMPMCHAARWYVARYVCLLAPTPLTTSIAAAIVVTAAAQHASTMTSIVTHFAAGPFVMSLSMCIKSLLCCIPWQTFLGACSI